MWSKEIKECPKCDGYMEKQKDGKWECLNCDYEEDD